jgi:hypothetical protein
VSEPADDAVEAFRSESRLLSPPEALSVRGALIDGFVRTDDPGFVERIGGREQALSGAPYLGYLWDYLRDAATLDESAVWARIPPDAKIRVLWDITPIGHVRIPNYFKLGHASVIEATAAQINKNRRFSQRTSTCSTKPGPGQPHLPTNGQAGSDGACGRPAPNDRGARAHTRLRISGFARQTRQWFTSERASSSSYTHITRLHSVPGARSAVQPL